MKPELLRPLSELVGTHLVGLYPLEEEVTLVACQESVSGHNETDVHG